MAKSALITGVTGQDGSYLAEYLLDRGYEVHGLIRRASTFNTGRIDHIYEDPHVPNPRLTLHYGDLTDGSQLARLVRTVEPDEIYNLAAQSHVGVSFQQPEYTADVGGLGVIRLLEAMRESGSPARLYQAGTSEVFGDAPPPQSEATPFSPRSPYAAAKAYAFWVVKNYREAYGMYAVTGTLFNHESPRRGETFVTRKITRALARIVAGSQDRLYLGNLDAKRDWGHARDYVQAMWMMLQEDDPADFVVGTGESRSVRDFLDVAFGILGIDWGPLVEIDPRYYRPTEVEHLESDPARIRTELGWEATVSFEDLVHEMVEADLAAVGLSVAEASDRASDINQNAT